MATLKISDRSLQQTAPTLRSNLQPFMKTFANTTLNISEKRFYFLFTTVSNFMKTFANTTLNLSGKRFYFLFTTVSLQISISLST